MKKSNLLAVLATATLFGFFSTPAKAENDTTLVKSPRQVEFFKDVTTDKAGDTKTTYYCNLDGKTYKSNKTSTERYATIKRFGGVPALVVITNGKGQKRVTVL